MAADFYSQFTPQEQKEFEQLTTPQQIQDYLRNLHGASEQERDPNSGRFVSRTQTAHTPEEIAPKAAADKAAAGPKEFKQTVNINGTPFEFAGTSAENLQLQIDSAKAVADQLQQDTPAPHRNIADEVWKANQLSEQFRSGVISPEEYLQASGALELAVEKRLKEAGFDVNKAAARQFEESWAEAAVTFVQSEAGQDWPGGTRNKELLALKISELGLVNASDKVAACAQAYADLKAKHMLFDGDVSQEEVEQLAIDSNATPQEILEAYKDTLGVGRDGDATEANKRFIEAFQNGRSSSGLFGR
jgi:hypothetical protein